MLEVTKKIFNRVKQYKTTIANKFILSKKDYKLIQKPTSEDKEIEIHLSEYSSLRKEIEYYSQRIDRIVGIYITVIFGIVGYLIRPETNFNIDNYLNNMESKPVFIAFLLFIPILNSLLIIRVGSFFCGILAITQYVHYQLRPRLNMLLGVNVLSWDDEPRMNAKYKWISLRSTSQIFFFGISEAISIQILVITIYLISLNYYLFILYIIAWLCVIVSVISSFIIADVGRNFHK